ncbi:MAG: hypothetical protein IVW51_03105 [Thermaceae bacterium]|nr:hypothetical protein [Thermaceae bacterium]
MNTPLLGLDGKAVIVALDHALYSGQIPPLDQPGTLLNQLLKEHPDGLIVTRGIQQLIPLSYRGQRWLTVDYYGTSVLPGQSDTLELQAPLWSPKTARAFGATGLKTLLVFGRVNHEVYLQNVQYVAKLVSEAYDVGLPVMVEPVLWGSRIPQEQQGDDALVAHATRIAFELGADCIKIPIPNNPGILEALTRALPIPIVLMGGPITDPANLFSLIRSSLDAGAAGVALGRNVWHHPNPAAMVAALNELVHHNARSKHALEMLGAGDSL